MENVEQQEKPVLECITAKLEPSESGQGVRFSTSHSIPKLADELVDGPGPPTFCRIAKALRWNASASACLPWAFKMNAKHL
jgi:hypothetical protein